MMTLRRMIDAMLFWLMIGAAVLACYAAVPSWSNVRLRSDAEIPGELLPGEYRGPTIEELIECFDRQHSKPVLSPVVIE
jgi:hypothetical protein